MVTTPGTDAMTMLLGESYHPGGLALTRRLATWLDPAPAERVLIIASGTTALFVAREFDVAVDAVDSSPATVALAQGAADAARLPRQVTFTVGDTGHLPYPAATFDVVLGERVFPDLPAAVELVLVLRPGGRLGITGLVADPARLPAELAGFGGIAGVRSLDDHAAVLTAAGLRIRRVERHDTVVLCMIDQIEARLGLLRTLTPRRTDHLGVDTAAARAAVADRTLGYGLLVVDNPVM